MKKLGFVLLALFVSVQAQAGLISYDFNGTGEGFTVTGKVVLDDADAMAGVNLAPSFVSWVFAWTNGVINGGASSSGDSFQFADFRIDMGGAVSLVSLCTNTCITGNLTDIFVTTNAFAASVPFAGSGPSGRVDGQGMWSGPDRVVTGVPEPGTLGLLGLGLAGLALARRRIS